MAAPTSRAATLAKAVATLGTGLAAIVVSGCANIDVAGPYADRPAHVETERPATPPAARIGTSVANLARELIGTPYAYGGSDPRGFDCSGLVFYTYSQAGLRVPRTSQDQFKAVRKIALAQADAGDLVFFQDQRKLSHVGIYLGDGLFVHAPETGRSVSIASLDAPYYQQHLVAVGRLL
jgi:cell wall-associated NlpC family hydrolase